MAKTSTWRARSVAGLASAAVAAAMLAPTTPAAAYTPNAMYTVAQTIGAPAMWNAGFTGKGVDIAIIDTGVTPVAGLDGTVADGRGKLYHGPDLSFDSQFSNVRYFDGYGHGTHMAGIMAGKDTGWTPGSAASYWAGIAPDSKILSLKVGDQGGTVDVTQMIAAIHWVVQHRTTNGLNIKVLNISYGTDDHDMNDVLLAATDVAWKAGIVVVASAGNSQVLSGLSNPSRHPQLVTAGGVDNAGTVTRSDDVAADFSQYATGFQVAPEVNAPATSIASLAVPGSVLDLAYPGARDGTRFFRGSGTSQSAAVISGAAALLFQQRPTAKPYQIMALMARSCPSCSSSTTSMPAHEMLDLAKAKDLPTPSASEESSFSTTGGGNVHETRGSALVSYNDATLTGEKDIFGKAWNSGSITRAAKNNKAWSGGSYNGNVWAGTSWSGNTFATATWSGTNFAGVPWSSITGTDNYWDGTGWRGTGWRAGKWQGTSWKSSVWAGGGWE